MQIIYLSHAIMVRLGGYKIAVLVSQEEKMSRFHLPQALEVRLHAHKAGSAHLVFEQ